MLQAELDRALLDPADIFDSPEAVLAREDLERDQKIEILQRWFYDANEVAVAQEEGMTGDQPLLVRRVSLALESLGATGEAVAHSATKHDSGG